MVVNSVDVMTSGSYRILVYGAGVLGRLYAARLWQAGRSVSLLARGQRLADLRKHGIVLEDRVTGERTVVRIPLAESLSPSDDYDVVLVMVRKNPFCRRWLRLATFQRSVS